MTDNFALIKELCESVAIGHIDGTLSVIEKNLPCEFSVRRAFGNCLIAELDCNKDKTLLIDAHLDEVGFIVTNVDDDGFLSVHNLGGIDLRSLPARRVTIHGKEDIAGIFCSIPPHLSGEEEQSFDDISKFYIDTGNKNADDIVSVGDYVTFCRDTVKLLGNKVSGKSLDNRAGCLALLLLAQKIKDKNIPCNVTLLFSNGEELGLRGAKTGAFSVDCNEAISIDVSFGNIPGISPEECKKLSSGAMLGASPILDKKMFDSLKGCAKENIIPYTVEVMGRSTGTNADVISVTKSGIPTGLISIPLRNMHSDCEIIDLDDVKAVSNLLYAYIVKDGNPEGR